MSELVYTYKGRDIETLEAPELRIAYRKLSDALDSERKAHVETLEMERLFTDTARAVRGQRG